jgi:hypothetical protein
MKKCFIVSVVLGLFFCLFSLSTISFSGELSYTCKILHVYDLDDKGFLRTSGWEKQFENSEFSVSRVTGEIIGKVLPTLLANSTKVINKGNKEWSFASIADFDIVNKPLSSGSEDKKSTASIQLLEVEEFHKGDSKPFFAVTLSGIVTGLCK